MTKDGVWSTEDGVWSDEDAGGLQGRSERDTAPAGAGASTGAVRAKRGVRVEGRFDPQRSLDDRGVPERRLGPTVIGLSAECEGLC